MPKQRREATCCSTSKPKLIAAEMKRRLAAEANEENRLAAAQEKEKTKRATAEAKEAKLLAAAQVKELKSRTAAETKEKKRRIAAAAKKDKMLNKKQLSEAKREQPSESVMLKLTSGDSHTNTLYQITL